ncbi:hypothetical protein LJB90_03675 [Eubacteriales bacterium OttesenSCG-928-G02]|nr:hypothetical protein [Eubacteriales bacterium OttesenSCG-928-G02]
MDIKSMDCKKTRLNTDLRLELVENRVKYLDKKIEEFNTERQMLSAESEILQSLRRLYAVNKEDPIDSGRKVFNKYEKAKTPEPGRTIKGDVYELLKICEAIVKQLMEVSGYSKNQVAFAIHTLKEEEKVVSIAGFKWKCV